MLCFMCSKSGDLLPATLLRDNIFLASALLKKTILPEELHNAVVCSNCQQTFLEYVELHRKLSNIEETFSQSNLQSSSSGLGLEGDPGPDNSIEIDNHEDYMLGDIILVEPAQLPSEEHDDAEHQFHVEIVSTLEEHEPHLDHVDVNGIPEMPEKVFGGDSSVVSEEIEGRRDEIHPEEPIPLKNYSKLQGGGYKCNFCEFSVKVTCETALPREKDTVMMINHLRDVHFIRIVICDLCGEEFPNTMEYMTHRRTHLTSSRKSSSHPCSHCSKTFSSSRQLSNHNRTVHQQETSPKKHGPLVCELCNKKYNSMALLEAHRNTHTGQRPYKCEICGADFTSRYNHNSHMKIHTDRPRPFKCSKCEKSFLNAWDLTKHEFTHVGTKNFECSICQKSFSTLHNLRQHQVAHVGHKPFICRTCGKSFARRCEVQDHERTHSGEKPYVCDVCGSAFSQRSNLATHKRTTHLKQENYKCEKCPKTFKRRRLLDYHFMAVHLKERAFKCELCPQTYTYPEHLKKHLVAVHGPEKQESCEICDKKFHSVEARNLHRFIHSEKRKMYECMVCEKGFMRRPLLISHMKLRNHLAEAIRVNSLKVVKEATAEDGGKIEEIKLAVESRLVDLVIEYEVEVEEPEEVAYSGGEDQDRTEEVVDCGEKQGGVWEKSADVIINSDKMFVLEMEADAEQFIGGEANGATGFMNIEGNLVEEVDGDDQEVGNIYMQSDQFGSSSAIGIVKRRRK